VKRLTILVVIAHLVAACGIPLQDAPDTLDSEVRPVTAPPVAGAIGPSGGTIYLVANGGLAPVVRERTGDAAALLALLFLGPIPAEEQAGLRSAIPPSAMLLEVTVEGRNAVVDVSRPFAGIGGQEEILAVAQIVLTLTADVADAVTIELEGTPVAVPLPDGALATAPVGFDDYAELIEG
jgi:hypothetical protein